MVEPQEDRKLPSPVGMVGSQERLLEEVTWPGGGPMGLRDGID